MQYDIIIVGTGPSGIFAALEISRRSPGKKILMFEKGSPIEERDCPKRRNSVCRQCPQCNITSGFSGAGAFSDGKLILSPEIGGSLREYMGDELNPLIEYVDEIYLSYGADRKTYGTGQEAFIEKLKAKAIQSNLKLVEAPIRHIGTEKCIELFTHIQGDLLSRGIEIKFNTPVRELLIDNGEIRGVVADRPYNAENVVIAAGREGAGWLSGMCEAYGIETAVGAVDLGVRIEVRNEIMEEINESLYESKLIYYTPTFDDMVRTFCHNPSGIVSTEYYDDNLAVVNGHCYKSEEFKTENTNFAILVSKHFTEPFKDPIRYGKYIARLANMLSGNRVIIQRLGDFNRGRRTTAVRLNRNNIHPTLHDAVPGDLGLVFPYRIMLDIREMIQALDNIFPGLDSNETLLYGVEVKFYSNRIKFDGKFESNIRGLYVAGDGAGITRGLLQASINGVVIGEFLSTR